MNEWKDWMKDVFPGRIQTGKRNWKLGELEGAFEAMSKEAAFDKENNSEAAAGVGDLVKAVGEKKKIFLPTGRIEYALVLCVWTIY